MQGRLKMSSPMVIDRAEKDGKVCGIVDPHSPSGDLDRAPVEIAICLGSSCFARGNAENLVILEQYVQNHEANASLLLTGKLCQEQCKEGPNLMIGGRLHHNVTAARLRELLQQLGTSHRELHETI
jgi:hypothetical protein